MATIRDVAKLAGVSMSTVSKYINGGRVRPENIGAIREAIEKLDYRVNPFARSLKAQRSRSIGILLPDLTAPFFSAVLTALDRVLREHGYHTLISCYGSDHGLERDNLSFLITNGIDGLVYIPEDLSAEEFYELTGNFNIPTVQVDRQIQGVQTDVVMSNNTDAVYEAVSRLLQKGHHKVAAVTGPKSVSTSKERLVGYLRALSDGGIMYDDEVVISENNDFATGYRSCEVLMQLEERPTAVLATNYDITMGMITAAHEQGVRIPEDLDIYGFDCVDICAMMKPPVPVVQQPEQEIGTTAARYLIQRLEGYAGEPRIVRLPCKLSL